MKSGLMVSVSGTLVELGHLGVPFLILSLWYLVPETKAPKWMSSMAFPVYILHYPIIGIVITIAVKRIPFINASGIYVTQWIASFVCSMIACFLMRRFVPRMAKVLFGGR